MRDRSFTASFYGGQVNQAIKRSMKRKISKFPIKYIQSFTPLSMSLFLSLSLNILSPHNFSILSLLSVILFSLSIFSLLSIILFSLSLSTRSLSPLPIFSLHFHCPLNLSILSLPSLSLYPLNLSVLSLPSITLFSLPPLLSVSPYILYLSPLPNHQL